jgi:CheY-like chemotaxis protein
MERDRAKCLNAGCNDFVTKPLKMETLLKAMGRYLMVADAAGKEPVLTEKAPAVAVSRETLVQKFYEELAGELAQIEQAIERQDRVRLREAAQLLLGKAAAAGLNDVAAQAAKLWQSAESERSWIVLSQAAAEFARDCQLESQAA